MGQAAPRDAAGPLRSPDAHASPWPARPRRDAIVLTEPPRREAAVASFWREWYRELRRHAGDARLPYGLRTRLRDASERAFQRSAAAERRAIVRRFNRRSLRDAPPVPFPDQRPVAVVELQRRPDRLTNALDRLRAGGYEIVHHEAGADAPLHLLGPHALVICSSAGLQHAACLTHTPSLRLDAKDPFTAYPVRYDGIFTLATPVDLDTGCELSTFELLTDDYFRHSRNCGYRPTSASDVDAAVAELVDGIRSGWTDSLAQAQFRSLVTSAGMTLGASVRHIVEWDADGEFVGDGRLARIQAERAL